MRRYLVYWKKKHYVLVAVIFIISLIALLRIQTFYSIGDRDAGVFAYIGDRVVQGDIPYKDVWDHKTPGIYYLNALLFVVFGSSLKVIALFEIFWLTVCAGVLYKIARRFLSIGSSLCTMLLFVIYVGSPHIIRSYGMTETYALLPSLLCVYFAVLFIYQRKMRDIFLSGVCVALAFLFRQTSAVVMVVPMLSVLYNMADQKIALHRRIFAFELLIAGFLVPILLVMAYFYLNDGLHDFVSQVFTFNFVYSEGLSSQYLAHFVQLVRTLLVTIGKYPLLIGLAGFGGLLACKAVFNAYNSRSKNNFTLMYTLLLAWFVADVFAVSYSGELYTHYFIQLLPSMALLSGIAVDWLINRFNTFGQLRSYAVFGLIIVVATPLFSVVAANTAFMANLPATAKTVDYIEIDGDAYVTTKAQVLSWVINHGQPDDQVYFWGAETGLNFLLEKESPSRYVYVYPLFTKGYANAQRATELLNDIRENRPRFIIDTAATNEKFQTMLISEEYRLVQPVWNYVLENYTRQESVGEWVIYQLP